MVLLGPSWDIPTVNPFLSTLWKIFLLFPSHTGDFSESVSEHRELYRMTALSWERFQHSKAHCPSQKGCPKTWEIFIPFLKIRVMRVVLERFRAHPPGRDSHRKIGVYWEGLLRSNFLFVRGSDSLPRGSLLPLMLTLLFPSTEVRYR